MTSVALLLAIIVAIDIASFLHKVSNIGVTALIIKASVINAINTIINILALFPDLSLLFFI